MPELDDKRYSIAEVSDLTGLEPHILRQWEKRVPELKPKRDRANRRYYLRDDIAIVRRLKYFVRTEKMDLAGARRKLVLELRGEGRPQTRQEAIDLVDKIEAEVRRLIHLLDSV